MCGGRLECKGEGREGHEKRLSQHCERRLFVFLWEVFRAQVELGLEGRDEGLQQAEAGVACPGRKPAVLGG
jgi:hypothetical protein